MSRLDDVMRFYELLDLLSQRLGGPRRLACCSGRDGWPERGVYFFFEDGELRAESGNGQRVVRIGTHCVSEGSCTTLWKRLRQHRGNHQGGGNHRGSVFRRLIGDALARRDRSLYVDSWLDRSASWREVKVAEYGLERHVSSCIGQMPFLWVTIDDPSSTDSHRAYIERNAIALLSNYGGAERIDGPSADWLGQHSSYEKVCQSGLWNSDHVDGVYDRDFLVELEGYIKTTNPLG